MNKKLIILLITLAWLWSCRSGINIDEYSKEHSDEIEPSTPVAYSTILSLDPLEKYIFTDSTYLLSDGQKITIQNSFPKGGGIAPDGMQYSDSSGRDYSFAVFWTRIVNDSDTQLELEIGIPADSFGIFTPPGSFLKLFLPPDTVRDDKLVLYNYGLTNTKLFLDANFHKQSLLQKRIDPGADCKFFVAALSYKAAGIPRAAMILKNQQLQYEVSISPHGGGTIPVGKVIFNKQDR